LSRHRWFVATLTTVAPITLVTAAASFRSRGLEFSWRGCFRRHWRRIRARAVGDYVVGSDHRRRGDRWQLRLRFRNLLWRRRRGRCRLHFGPGNDGLGHGDVDNWRRSGQIRRDDELDYLEPIFIIVLTLDTHDSARRRRQEIGIEGEEKKQEDMERRRKGKSLPAQSVEFGRLLRFEQHRDDLQSLSANPGFSSAKHLPQRLAAAKHSE
jgi:hypothetical protein